MKVRFSTPIKLTAIIGSGLVLIAGGLLLFNRSLPFLRSRPEAPTRGAIFGIRSQIPQDFPQEIPLFEPATIRSTTKSQERIHVVLETEEKPKTVLAFYKNQMAKLGWEAIETFKPKGGEAWVFSKGSKRLELIVVQNEEEKRTLIFLKTNTT